MGGAEKPEPVSSRRLEVVADGLTAFRGAQLAIDTTLMSAVRDVINIVEVPQILYDRAVDVQVVHGRWWILFYEGLCVCVLEACDVRIVIAAILEENLMRMFGIPVRIQRMRVKDCTANSRAWGRPRT